METNVKAFRVRIMALVGKKSEDTNVTVLMDSMVHTVK